MRLWTSPAWSACSRIGDRRHSRGQLRSHRAVALGARSPVGAPYAYLDDAPLEERRTQAVIGRRWLDPESASDLGRLDEEAIARVRVEAGPSRQAQTSCTTRWCGSASWPRQKHRPAGTEWLVELQRVARLLAPSRNLWIAAERLPQFEAIWPKRAARHRCAGRACARVVARGGPGRACAWPPRRAGTRNSGGARDGSGTRTDRNRRRTRGARDRRVRHARPLHSGGAQEEWCERRLLARVHRYTVKRLRAEIEPVAARDFMRFLDWQHVTTEARMEGPDALYQVVAQLEASRRPPAPGRRRSCRPASTITTRRGSMTSALPGASPGHG